MLPGPQGDGRGAGEIEIPHTGQPPGGRSCGGGQGTPAAVVPPPSLAELPLLSCSVPRLFQLVIRLRNCLG